MMEIDQVVKCFFLVLYSNTNNTPPKLIRKILKEAESLNNKGWRYQDICNKIIEFDKKVSESTKKVKSLYQIDDLQDKTPYIMKDGNLLEDKFYYHNKLQVKPDPPTVWIDDQGKVNRKSSKYFIEIVNEFTLNDLNKYFSKRLNVNNNLVIKNNKKKLKYLIKTIDLDTLLFTIDYSYNFLTDKGYRLYNDANKIVDYLDNGIDLYSQAKNSQKGVIKPYYNVYLEKRGEQSCE